MTYRTALLTAILIFVIGLGAGFALDRWLHRPITAGGMTLQFAANSGPNPAPSPTPIPPCLINCDPGDDSGNAELIPEPETQASCYGDGSIPCPGQAPKVRAYGDCKETICSPQERECWWALGGDYCQKET